MVELNENAGAELGKMEECMANIEVMLGKDKATVMPFLDAIAGDIHRDGHGVK